MQYQAVIRAVRLQRAVAAPAVEALFRLQQQLQQLLLLLHQLQ